MSDVFYPFNCLQYYSAKQCLDVEVTHDIHGNVELLLLSLNHKVSAGLSVGNYEGGQNTCGGIPASWEAVLSTLFPRESCV